MIFASNQENIARRAAFTVLGLYPQRLPQARRQPALVEASVDFARARGARTIEG